MSALEKAIPYTLVAGAAFLYLGVGPILWIAKAIAVMGLLLALHWIVNWLPFIAVVAVVWGIVNIVERIRAKVLHRLRNAGFTGDEIDAYKV
jgi:hypothetical protein